VLKEKNYLLFNLSIVWLQIIIILDGKIAIYISQISAYFQFTKKSIILFQNIITSLKFWIKYNEISYEKKTKKHSFIQMLEAWFYRKRTKKVYLNIFGRSKSPVKGLMSMFKVSTFKVSMFKYDKTFGRHKVILKTNTKSVKMTIHWKSWMTIHWKS
jgi:hypothetical protein